MVVSLERELVMARDGDVELKAQTSDAVQAAEAEAETPDLVMGDMETDLPVPALARADAAEQVTAEEIEIPWAQAHEEQDAEVAEAVVQAPGESAEMPTAEPQVETGAAPKGAIKRAWYVVHCYSGYENKVKKGLEQRINSMELHDRLFRVVVPIEKEVEIKEGQRRNIERRVFPGYILVEMMELKEGEPDSDQVWYVVRNTPGVTGFVGAGEQQRPVALREDEVAKILQRMETAEPKVHVTFRVGQTVHIIDGPFADFRGTVDNVDMTKGKVRVLVSFFGRETPVELDLLQVEKV